MMHVEQLLEERIAEERKNVSERQDQLINDFRSFDYENALLDVLNLIEQANSLDEVKFALLDFVVATKNEMFALRDAHESLSSRVETMNDHPDPDEF